MDNDQALAETATEPDRRAALHAVYADRFTRMARFAAARLGDGAAVTKHPRMAMAFRGRHVLPRSLMQR